MYTKLVGVRVRGGPAPGRLQGLVDAVYVALVAILAESVVAVIDALERQGKGVR